MTLRGRVITIIGGVTIIATMALLFASIISSTWSTTDGSPKVTLGLWSICTVSNDNTDCATWENCYLVFSASSCLKLYFARIFMTISAVSSLFGFLCVIVFLVLFCKRSRNREDGSSAVSLCFHLLSFVSGIIGFPLGISFALVLPSSTVGLSAILAIVAVILNLVSMVLLCVDVGTSKDGTVPADQNSGEEAQVGEDHPSNPSVQYTSAADDVNVF